MGPAELDRTFLPDGARAITYFTGSAEWRSPGPARSATVQDAERFVYRPAVLSSR